MPNIHCFDFFFCFFFNIYIVFNQKAAMKKLHDKQEVVKELHNIEEVHNTYMVKIVKPQSMQSLIWLRLAP